MKMILKLYLKLFLAYGLAFGFIMTLWDYIDEGEIIFIKSIVGMVLFGGFMSWFTIKSVKQSKQRFGKKELTEEDFNATQCVLIQKNKSVQEIYDLLNSNEVTKKWKLKYENLKIVGKTKVSWSSWGERILIEDLIDKIKITSKPIMSISFFDDGRNRENVILLKKIIEKC